MHGAQTRLYTHMHAHVHICTCTNIHIRGSHVTPISPLMSPPPPPTSTHPLIPPPQGLDPVDVALDEESEETAFDPDAVDSLREELVRRRMAVSATVLRAARVLAPALGPTRAAGFEWAAGQLREMGMARLAGEVELCKAEALLGGRDFAGAVEILKSFERKDKASDGW